MASRKKETLLRHVDSIRNSPVVTGSLVVAVLTNEFGIKFLRHTLIVSGSKGERKECR